MSKKVLEKQLDKVLATETPETMPSWLYSNRENIMDLPKITLANNIDGLRDALEDDDLFFFYKGVIQCYGEEMFKLGQENLYTKEQVLEHLNHLVTIPSTTLDKYTDEEEKVTMKWFDQFKK